MKLADLEEKLSVVQHKLDNSALEKRQARVQAQLQAQEFQDMLADRERRITDLEKTTDDERKTTAAVSEQLISLQLQFDTVVARAGELSMKLAESRSTNDELKDQLAASRHHECRNLGKRPSLLCPSLGKMLSGSAVPGEIDATESTQDSEASSLTSLDMLSSRHKSESFSG